MKPIAIYNYKGGVGKSTIAINLAETIAARSPACVVDCDPQCSASFHMLGVGEAIKAMRQPASGHPKTIRYLMDWIGTNEENSRPAKNLPLDVPGWKAKLICSDMSLTELEMELVLHGRGDAQRIWRTLCQLNEDDFHHWPILDCSPSYSFFTIAATYSAAGGIFIPVTTEQDSLYGINLTARALDRVARLINPALIGKCGQISGIICNRVEPKKKEALRAGLNYVIDIVRPAFPKSFAPNFKILETILPEDPQIVGAGANRSNIRTFAPNSESVKAYDNLYQEIKTLIENR